MAFGLTIGTERANVLQTAIQDELANRGWGTEPDVTMAEYITIMLINGKSEEQINNELMDLIGPDYDESFGKWLFVEAGKGSSEANPTPPTPPTTQSNKQDTPLDRRDQPIPNANDAPLQRRQGGQPRPHHPATNQALPSGTKRSASPSSLGPNKSRRTDVPSGPRAMLREGRDSHGGGNTGRSLLERVGPRGPGFPQEQQQPQIPVPPVFQNGMVPGVDMNAAIAAQMGNPILLQEMMMNQMALMAQMAGAMGMVPPGTFIPGQPGFQDMGMANGMNNGFVPPHQQRQQQQNSGRRGPNNRGQKSQREEHANPQPQPPPAPAPPVVAPQPVQATPAPAPTQRRPTYAPPDRPQSPTLCKYSLKCTNPSCRYSHPSPVATQESGIVLSNDPCEQGKDCKDKDCVKAHVSPAVLKPKALEQNRPLPPPVVQHQPSPPAQVQCRYGASCTKVGCPFLHPYSSTQCRYGTGCTRANCHFQHPEGRVLPNSFHRGVSSTDPTVTVTPPQTGTIHGPASSQNKTLTLTKEQKMEALQKKMKELEAQKSELKKKAEQAEAKKKEDGKPVAITA